MYYTIVVPYVSPPFRTEWHPDRPTGPFSVLCRGAFKTEGEAIAWAREHLGGTPYILRQHASPEALGTLTKRARKLSLDRFIDSLTDDERHEIDLSGAPTFGDFWGEASDQ